MASWTRREMMTVAAGALLPRPARAALLTNSAVDHLKIRVADALATARFYRRLFGGRMFKLSNNTYPTQPVTDEFYVELAPDYPYVIFAQAAAGQALGLDHIRVRTADSLPEGTWEGQGIAQVYPSLSGITWIRDPEGNVLELAPGSTLGPPGLPYKVGKEYPPDFRHSHRLEARAIEAVGLRVSNLDRVGDFYARVLGTEQRRQSKSARSFRLGQTLLELHAADGSGGSLGLDLIRVAVPNLSAGTARKDLRRLGISSRSHSGMVMVSDTDGRDVQITPA